MNWELKVEFYDFSMYGKVQHFQKYFIFILNYFKYFTAFILNLLVKYAEVYM